MTSLENIVNAGVAAYRATLPAYDAELMASVHRAELETTPNITIPEERQAQICLSCPLPDCVGIENPACPIRREQCRIWRENRRST